MAAELSYFALLGVGEDVNQEELEARYQELAEYLASPAIPPHLQEWARRQTALVDEAYAVLADPERRAAVYRERHRDQGPAEPGKEPQKEPPERASPHAGAGRAPPQPERSQFRVSYGLAGFRLQPLLLGVLIGLVVLGAILLGRYGFPSGGAGEVTEPEEDASVLVPLDSELVAELMAAVEQDPNNPEVLFDLGETFFQASEWQPAIDWFTKLLAVEPNNIHARTDVGTANFNLGQPEEAKAAWLAALEIAPDNVQVHYNLGFLYANAEPRDLASARQEWQTVVSLAPDSELARTAQVHLESLEEEAQEEAPPTPPQTD